MFYAPQTKILEGLTKDEMRLFEALFKGVSTRFWLRTIENPFENQEVIFCQSFQNLRLGSILLFILPKSSFGRDKIISLFSTTVLSRYVSCSEVESEHGEQTSTVAILIRRMKNDSKVEVLATRFALKSASTCYDERNPRVVGATSTTFFSDPRQLCVPMRVRYLPNERTLARSTDVRLHRP